MTTSDKTYPFFILALISFCLCYLGFELLYNHYTMISVDEFWFAHRIYQYKDGIPYRDFAPYKTILGYYMLLPPMMSGRGILQTLLFTKDYIAVFNTFVLLASSLWLTRFFSRTGVLISLAILISAEIVLSYSTQLRVDLLGYWFCFFSLLALLDKRYWFAGLLIGLGFATTQKAIWCIFASNCGLGLYWLLNTRDIKTFKNIVAFNIVSAVVIALYLVFWSWISDWHTVMTSVFHEASVMYHLDWYDPFRVLFWKTIINYNPLLFMLWPVTLLSLFITYEGDKSYQNRFIVVTYAYVILLCLIPYKQVFPYYMQVTIPIYFALYAAFTAWLFDIFKTGQTLLFRAGHKITPIHNVRFANLFFWMLAGLYIAAIIFTYYTLHLIKLYLLICIIPVLLVAYFTMNASLQQKSRKLIFDLIAITIVFVGFLYPLALMPAKINMLRNDYQQDNLLMSNQLLQDGSEYVAGIELFYDKTQAIPGMRHLMGPAIDFLYAPTPKLKEVMLDSLYEDPNATPDTVINAFKKSSVKLYINNYRMHAIPKKIKRYLNTEYAHWWGSIYLYAPVVSKGSQDFTLKFPGKYRIDSTASHSVELNGMAYVPGTILTLPQGHIISKSDNDYRLTLIPDEKAKDLNPAFKNDDWSLIMF